jgi:PPOX class probable F420-dependent enzyme
MIDLKTKFGRKVWKHIRREHTVWLTTVGPDGTPHPRPVWFAWDEGEIVIYSQPGAFKVKHIKKHKRVALNFNTDASGDTDVIVILGEARIDKSAPQAHKMKTYFKKYREMIPGIKMTPEEYGGGYSVAIRVTPTSIRGW